jgi:hypothetical protein
MLVARNVWWGFRRRRTLIPKGTRTAFRAEGEQSSERSDAGTSIVQEVFGFVKRNLSVAQRRKDAASGERGAGKGGRPCPASAFSDLERVALRIASLDQHCGVAPKLSREMPTSVERVIRAKWRIQFQPEPNAFEF